MTFVFWIEESVPLTELWCSMEFWLGLYGSPDGRGVWGRMDTCICMAESLCCPPETIPALLVGYTPIQNKKLKKTKKKCSEGSTTTGVNSCLRIPSLSFIHSLENIEVRTIIHLIQQSGFCRGLCLRDKQDNLFNVTLKGSEHGTLNSQLVICQAWT